MSASNYIPSGVRYVQRTWTSNMVKPDHEKAPLENLASALLLPSQKGHWDRKTSVQALRSYSSEIDNLIVHYVDRSKSMDFIIYYHDRSMLKNVNKCVLFFNPNGAVVADYFTGPKWTRKAKHLNGGGLSDFVLMPAFLSQLENCPVIIPDYRGAGLGKRNIRIPGIFFDSKVPFQADAASMCEDATVMIKHAASMFGSISVWGSSIGGGASTIGLTNYLTNRPDETFRFQLTNHNSFKSTASVVSNHMIVTSLIGGLGVNMKAGKAMDMLVEKGVKITIIAHLNDKTIKPGSQMVEYIQEKHGDKLPDNVTLLTSESDHHMKISASIVTQLYKREFEAIVKDPRKLKILEAQFKQTEGEHEGKLGWYTPAGKFFLLQECSPYNIDKYTSRYIKCQR